MTILKSRPSFHDALTIHHESWSRGRSACIWGSLLTSRGFVGTEGEHLRLSGRQETAGLWQTGQSETCTEGHATALHAPDWDMCLPVWATGRLRAGIWDWRVNPVKKTTVGCEEIARGDGREEICNQGMFVRWNPDCHRSKVLLLSDTRGWSHHCRLFLPTHWTPALQVLRKAPQGADLTPAPRH